MVSSGRTRAKRGTHQTAGFILFIGQESGDFLTGAFIEEIQELRTLVVGGGLDYIGGIIGRQLAYPQAAFSGGQPFNQVELFLGAEAEEEVLGILPGKHMESLNPVLPGQYGPDMPKIVFRNFIVHRLFVGHAAQPPFTPFRYGGRRVKTDGPAIGAILRNRGLCSGQTPKFPSGHVSRARKRALWPKIYGKTGNPCFRRAVKAASR